MPSIQSNLALAPQLPALPVAPRALAAPQAPAAQSAVRDQLQLSPTLRQRGPLAEQVVFLGLNDSSQEIASLKKQATLSVIQNQPLLNGLDLKTDAGIQSFVSSLKLSGHTSEQLSEYLRELEPEVRDEMAQVIQAWAPAERDQAIPARLVLSGHSTGRGIFGEGGRGSLSFEAFGKLAGILPKAAAQIEDIHIGACNTGFRVNSEIFQANFPQLKTFWAYVHTAPSQATGSPAHMRRWEKLTRGDTSALSREQAAQGFGVSSHPENIVVWTRENGYQSNEKAIRLSESELQQAVERYLSGEAESTNPGSGFLKEVYDQLQSVRGNTTDEKDLKRYDALIDRALKLRYYPQVASNFQSLFGPELKEVCKDLALNPVDFSKMGRREALLASTRLQTALKAQEAGEGLSPTQAKMQVLLAALDDLSPALMAEEWIEPLVDSQSEALRAKAAELKLEDVQANKVPVDNSWLDDFLRRMLEGGFGFPGFGGLGLDLDLGVRPAQPALNLRDLQGQPQQPLTMPVLGPNLNLPF